MSNNYEVVNAAIADCLIIGPSDNWDYKKNLKSKYSNDTYNRVLSILTFIKSLQPNWQLENIDMFLQRCKIKIAQEFPFLNDTSIHILVNRIAYEWK